MPSAQSPQPIVSPGRPRRPRARLALAALAVACAGLAVFASAVLPISLGSSAATGTARLGKIAYVQDGDVWTKALPDGDPVRITDDQRSMAPAWSPSGEWVTLLKSVERGNPETWVVRADGSDTRRLDARFQLSNNATRLWSPADDRLLYLTDDGDIIAEDADGANRSVLVARDRANSAESLSYPIWSPDGSAIAFARQSRPLYEALWHYDIRDGLSQELYSYVPPEGQIVPAAWSPDGREVYFWRSPIYSASIQADGLPLWAVPSDGGQARDLGLTTLLYADYLDFAADGRLVVVDGGGRESVARKALSLIEPSGMTTLTSPDNAAISPAWSPDASTIVFVEAPAAPNYDRGLIEPMADRRLWFIHPDGSDPRRVLPDVESAQEGPLWSRDGRHLLYVEPSYTSSREQFRLDATVWLVDLSNRSQAPVVEGLGTEMRTYTGFYYSHMDWRFAFDWWQPR